jgi:hypothetical protein
MFCSNEKINLRDALIILLNGTNLHNEEKFKFTFLCLDEESTKFLGVEELENMIRLNFMAKEPSELKRRLKLVTDEVKLMNVYDNEIYDYDILFAIMKKKPNYFYPI